MLYFLQKMSKGMKIFAGFKRIYYGSQNYGFARYLSSYNKDLIKPTPGLIVHNDYLLQNLKNATTPQKVLELVGSHHKIMNSKQLMQALRSLFTLQKYGNSNLSMQQIISHSDFDRLCYYLKAQAGMIELNETIEALKVVSYVGVSSNSTIVQVLLQLLRHNVNDLSLQQIIFLDFLLRQFKSSPLVDGLLIALPIVFEIHVPIKMDRENVSHMADCLQYVAKKIVSENCVKLITRSLIKYIDTHQDLDNKIGKSIIWSICDMPENELFEPLLKKVVSLLLANDFGKMDYQDITTTMYKLIYKYSVKYPFYYDEAFIDTCANYVVDRDLGFDEAVHMLHKLIRINHLNENLLNYVTAKCYKDPALLTQSSTAHVYAIAVSASLTDVRPVHWETIKQTLLTSDWSINYSKRDVVWMKFAASLCSLDVYRFDLLDKVLNQSHIEKMFKQNFLSDYEKLLLITQAIAVFQPDLKHLLPSKSVIDKIVSKLKPVLEYPLEGSLQRALGGENYVKTCIKSRLGHQIDHAIILRKGGYPVSLSNYNNNNQYLEDMEVPTDSQIILILAMNSLHYTINNNRLKATSTLTIKTLEAQGYTVVSICLDMWESLPDFEKIPYLMQTIRSKTEPSIKLTDAVC